jgi:hypothetical protein
MIYVIINKCKTHWSYKHDNLRHPPVAKHALLVFGQYNVRISEGYAVSLAWYITQVAVFCHVSSCNLIDIDQRASSGRSDNGGSKHI